METGVFIFWIKVRVFPLHTMYTLESIIQSLDLLDLLQMDSKITHIPHNFQKGSETTTITVLSRRRRVTWPGQNTGVQGQLFLVL